MGTIFNMSKKRKASDKALPEAPKEPKIKVKPGIESDSSNAR